MSKLKLRRNSGEAASEAGLAPALPQAEAAQEEGRQERLDAAVRRLADKAPDSGTFSADGMPRLDALAAALGGAVTPAERDAAWHRLQAERAARRRPAAVQDGGDGGPLPQTGGSYTRDPRTGRLTAEEG